MASPIAEGVVPWPDDAVARYVAAGYWEGNSLGWQLWKQADRTPDQTAVVDGDVALTYGELIARADAAATGLANLGMRPGDRIVVQLPNGWEFIVLTLACLRAGIVPVMALPGHRRHELSYLAAHAEAAAIAVPDELRGFDHQDLGHELVRDVDGLRHVLVAGGNIRDGSVDLRQLCAGDANPAAHRARWDAADPSSRDVAVFLLSGGTTGLPKLIARTHDDYVYNAKRSGELAGLGPDTVYLVAVPAGHNFPLACPGILGTLLVGGRVVMLPSPEPVRAFTTIERERVTHTAVVPAAAQRWLDEYDAEKWDLSSLRVLQVGGARLAEEVARMVRPVLGCTLQQVFGMAEGLLNYTRLDDPDEHNARAFTADRWYRSGDICRWHTSGNLVVEGRDKDMINRGGEKISAEEIENLAYQMPAVMQAAAVAMPDPSLGDRLCLYVVARPGAEHSLDDVRASMASKGVASFKLPDRLVLCEEIPTTKVGKIDKKALRADT